MLAYLCVGVLMFPTPGWTSEYSSGFMERKLMLGMTIAQYQIYVPHDWSDTKSWPVILSLHGAGERGHDGQRQTQVGLGAILRQFPDRVPAVVAFPQCREGASWIDSDMEQLALLTLEQAIREYNGDKQRVYLTGISMGAQGAWYLAMKQPHRFAAVAPIAGRTRQIFERFATQLNVAGIQSTQQIFQSLTKRIHTVPIWAFHGREDRTVPVEETRSMVTALRKEGTPIIYTEYPTIGHHSWDAAYAEPHFFSWLFSQHVSGEE